MVASPSFALSLGLEVFSWCWCQQDMSHYSEPEYASYITSSIPPDQVVPEDVDGVGKIEEGAELARMELDVALWPKKVDAMIIHPF